MNEFIDQIREFIDQIREVLLPDADSQGSMGKHMVTCKQTGEYSFVARGIGEVTVYMDGGRGWRPLVNTFCADVEEHVACQGHVYLQPGDRITTDGVSFSMVRVK